MGIHIPVPRLFKLKTGVTPGAYRDNQKME